MYSHVYLSYLTLPCVFLTVMVEVDGRDSMELGMEDIEENIEDIVDLFDKVFSNLVANIDFGVEMDKVSKERVCSNYF